MGPIPVAATLNCANWPCATVLLVGCCVMTGGVITGIPEDTDLAQALSDRETTDLLVHLLDQNREQVERALERLREGAYGICEGCGRRIPEARLKYQPAATRCVECQAHWDRLNGRTA